jgi:hypothetical protein
MKLQRDQHECRHRGLDRKRQLQRPDEAGQDQDIDQTDNELGNRFAPDLDRCSCLHELWRYLDLNSLRPRQRAGGFVMQSAVSGIGFVHPLRMTRGSTARMAEADPAKI